MALNPMRTPALVERFSADGCFSDTGMRPSTLVHLWSKYHAWNGSAAGTFGGQVAQADCIDDRAFHFYCVFVLIHKHPQKNWKSQFTSRNGWKKLRQRGRYTHVYPVAHALASIIDEIDRGRRLEQHNHGVPPFEYFVTGMVDTLPIYVPQPHRWALARLLYQPKYKATVLKWQLGIMWNGEIILFTGPHLGTTADVTIWESTWADHPFYDWELWLGDLGYMYMSGRMGSCTSTRRKEVTTLHRSPAGGCGSTTCTGARA